MSTFARTDTSMVGRWWWTVDRWMLVVVALLIGTGFVLTMAASPAVAERLGGVPHANAVSSGRANRHIVSR